MIRFAPVLLLIALIVPVSAVEPQRLIDEAARDFAAHCEQQPDEFCVGLPESDTTGGSADHDN